MSAVSRSYRVVRGPAGRARQRQAGAVAHGHVPGREHAVRRGVAVELELRGERAPQGAEPHDRVGDRGGGDGRPRGGGRAGEAHVVDQDPRGGIAVEAVHVDEEDAHHAERPVVERGLAVGELVVGGEGVVVEVGQRRRGAADGAVGVIGEREDGRVRAGQPQQIEEVAPRVADGVAGGLRVAADVGRLGDPDGAREPAQRRHVVVGERLLDRAEPGERGAVGGGELRQPLLGGVVDLVDHDLGLEALDVAGAEVGAGDGPVVGAQDGVARHAHVAELMSPAAMVVIAVWFESCIDWR